MVAEHALHAMEYRDTWRLVNTFKISMSTAMDSALLAAIVQASAAKLSSRPQAGVMAQTVRILRVQIKIKDMQCCLQATQLLLVEVEG